MDDSKDLSDQDLLNKLRLDYLQALEAEDYRLINDVIIPRFWGRFGKYYGEYERSWKSPSVSRLPVSVVIDPRQSKEAELMWAEHVLKGRIEPFP